MYVCIKYISLARYFVPVFFNTTFIVSQFVQNDIARNNRQRKTVSGNICHFVITTTTRNCSPFKTQLPPSSSSSSDYPQLVTWLPSRTNTTCFPLISASLSRLGYSFTRPFTISPLSIYYKPRFYFLTLRVLKCAISVRAVRNLLGDRVESFVIVNPYFWQYLSYTLTLFSWHLSSVMIRKTYGTHTSTWCYLSFRSSNVEQNWFSSFQGMSVFLWLIMINPHPPCG